MKYCVKRDVNIIILPNYQSKIKKQQKEIVFDPRNLSSCDMLSMVKKLLPTIIAHFKKKKKTAQPKNRRCRFEDKSKHWYGPS